MSEVVYSTVIRTEGKKNERVEMMVDIYENADSVRDHDIRTDTNTQQPPPPQPTGSECVKNRSFRSVSVCLVVLCVLLLTAVIVMCVLIHTNNHQSHIKNKNITEERDELKAKYSNITKLHEQLNWEKNELMKYLHDGWIYYKFSFYYISFEKKNWTESRRYCTDRGADLIIINNNEEQDFVKNLSGSGDIWIGLSDSDVEGTWKWVDGSTLTSGFWAYREPNGHKKENCVASYTSVWYDYPCTDTAKWICEKSIK